MIDQPNPQQPSQTRVDSRGRQYIICDGQIHRMSQDGAPLPRVRLSKKERLRLRREYLDISTLNSTELADKILKTPVINPLENPELD